MLVLSRSTEDAIVIGDHIEVTVLEIRNNSVKLGVSAPAEISVHRSEVYVRIKLDKHLESYVRPGEA